MTPMQAQVLGSDDRARSRAAIGLWAVFITQFVSFLFIYARNIAMPGIIAEMDGMGLFSWLIALPALSGSASTLLFGKLSDIFGRRAMLLVSIGLFLLGLGLSATVTTMAGLVAAATFMSIGHFPIIPLCFTAIGDLFPPAERAKWTGLLSLPTGVAALIGPMLGGMVAESVLGWRWLYWGTIPLMVIAGILLITGLADTAQKIKPRIDVVGTLVMIVATTTLIFGFAGLGVPERRGLGAILLTLSVAAWMSFVLIEKRVEAPILDPQVFQNGTFMRVAATSVLSLFGTLGIVAYSPIFAQQVMKVSPTLSGSMLTPYSLLTAFLGIPAGFLLARTGRYKWMIVLGYGIVTIAMAAMWSFTADTPVWLYVLVTSVAGFGFGAIPTINTLVAQFAVPKRLLGVAIGAMYFFQMVGMAAAPALIGLAQNSAADLEGGLKLVFLVGAACTMASLILVFAIRELPMEAERPG